MEEISDANSRRISVRARRALNYGDEASSESLDTASTTRTDSSGSALAPDPPSVNNVPKSTPRKRRRTSELADNSDENTSCPICLDGWTSQGTHRLCALKCGHLFGKSCVERWLLTSKTCPSCNQKARKQDLRPIYAKKLVAVDNTEVEDVRTQLINCQRDLGAANNEIASLKSLVKCLKETVQKLQQAADEERAKLAIAALNSIKKTLLLRAILRKMIKLDDGICRVMAHNRTRDMVAVSQENTGPLWRGYGIRLLKANEQPLPGHTLPLHKREIRDLAFHPTNQDLMLTVSFDCEVKVHDISDNQLFFHWKSEEAIWSACWGFDSDSSVFIFIGTGRGRLFRLNTTAEDAVLQLPNGNKFVPVCSLKPSLKLNSLLCCRFFSVEAYTQGDDNEFRQDVLFEGVYSGMTFCETDNNEPTMVVCCRPSDSQPKERFVVYRLSVNEGGAGKITASKLHVIYGGEQASPLSRPLLHATKYGLFFYAFVESSSSIYVWLLGQDQKMCSIRTDSLVKDIVAVNETIYVLCSNILKKYELTVSS